MTKKKPHKKDQHVINTVHVEVRILVDGDGPHATASKLFVANTGLTANSTKDDVSDAVFALSVTAVNEAAYDADLGTIFEFLDQDVD